MHRAQAAEAAHPQQPTIALPPDDSGDAPPPEACMSTWPEAQPALVRQVPNKTSQRIVLWAMVGVLAICAMAYVAPVTRACGICCGGLCRKREVCLSLFRGFMRCAMHGLAARCALH